MVYSFDNKDDINKIKIHDCAFYGFEYRQKKSEVEIYCKNEMTKEEINIIDKISIESFFIFIYNPLIALCLYNILCTK